MQLLNVVVLSLQRCEASVPIMLQGMGELCLLESLRELRLRFRCSFAPRRLSKLGASLSLLGSLTHLEVARSATALHSSPPEFGVQGVHCCSAVCGCLVRSHSRLGILSCRDWLKRALPGVNPDLHPRRWHALGRT